MEEYVMRTWYEALEEDYEINLENIRKENADANIISDRTLRDYRKLTKTPNRDHDKDKIVRLVSIKVNGFTQAKLQKYLNGNYAEKPLDHIKIQAIKNIRDALKDVKSCGIELDSLTAHQPDKLEELAEWVYLEMRSTRWHSSISPFLERIRIQLKKTDDVKVFNAVKELHKAIAPLIILNVNCVKTACEKLSSLKGIDQLNGPAIAALAIAFSKGLPLSFEATKPDGKFTFHAPDNAIIENDFSLEGDIHERVLCRVLQRKGLLEHSATKLKEDDWSTLKMLGEHNDDNILPLFIYLNNEGVGYDIKQLEEMEFSGFYKFSTNASHELEVTGDAFAVKWLLITFNDLYEHEVAIIKSLRQYIIGMSNTAESDEITELKELAETISNDRVFLEKIEGLSSTLSNVTQTAVNLPDAINNSASMFETAQSWLSFLTEFTNGSGVS